ncbi:hypothetical protein ACFWNN_00065 [Lentzea sp. NPDC058450]|uniref:hypothetical protein n=1 Tax=Lentzea sp. NPDC058450 TaxID=3346505 RepID=UPI00366A53CE
MPSFFRRGRQEPEPPPRPAEAALAVAWFCDRLPALRARADRLGWRRELEAEVEAVKDGRPAREAMHNLMLDDFGTDRGDGAAGLQALWDPAPIGQRFACPRHACPDRGRGADASEPWCHLDDRPMTPSTHRLDP